MSPQETHEDDKTRFLKITLGVVLPVLLVIAVLIGIGLAVKPVKSVIKKWKEGEGQITVCHCQFMNSYMSIHLSVRKYS